MRALTGIALLPNRGRAESGSGQLRDREMRETRVSERRRAFPCSPDRPAPTRCAEVCLVFQGIPASCAERHRRSATTGGRQVGAFLSASRAGLRADAARRGSARARPRGSQTIPMTNGNADRYTAASRRRSRPLETPSKRRNVEPRIVRLPSPPSCFLKPGPPSFPPFLLPLPLSSALPPWTARLTYASRDRIIVRMKHRRRVRVNGIGSTRKTAPVLPLARPFLHPFVDFSVGSRSK